MPFLTKRQRVTLSAEEKAELESLRRSRSGEKRKILHAAILLDSASGMSDGAVARSAGVNRHTVALCVRKFLQFGLDAALGELPRPGKSRRIPDDALAWVQHCACEKPKELGYAEELWTISLLQKHVRKHCTEAGHPSLIQLSRSRLHRILTQSEVRPHKIRYYVERGIQSLIPRWSRFCTCIKR
jgi:transposase